MVRRVKIDAVQPDSRAVSEAASVIKQGGLIILPTDTAYGLAGNPLDSVIVQKILAVKRRDSKSGMPVLAASLDQVREFTIFSEAAEQLARSFWPGGLTLILPASRDFPEGVKGPGDSLGVRVPDHPVALAIIRQTGFAITGTSANKSDAPSPRNVEDAILQVGEAGPSGCAAPEIGSGRRCPQAAAL